MKWSINTSVTKIFSRDTNILSPKHQILHIFGLSAPSMTGLHMSLNYSQPNVKKMVCPKICGSDMINMINMSRNLCQCIKFI